MTKLLVAISIAVITSTPAFAKGGNSSEARAMADALKGGLATAGGAINPGKKNNGRGTASDVSGGGNGGWGNIGSTLTGTPGASVSGR